MCGAQGRPRVQSGECAEEGGGSAGQSGVTTGSSGEPGKQMTAVQTIGSGGHLPRKKSDDSLRDCSLRNKRKSKVVCPLGHN